MSARNRKESTRAGKLASLTKADSSLIAHIKPGLQGIKSTDKKQISATPPDYVSDSLDLDAAFESTGKNDNRWDYWVGTSDHIVAIEIHPAKPSEVSVMIRKKEWGTQKASEHLSRPHIKMWYWIASGATQISRTTTEYRRMIQAGIELKGSYLNLSKPK